MTEEIKGYIAETVDSIDKIIIYLKTFDLKTKEFEIAIQKLEEAVFWLTYGGDENE